VSSITLRVTDDELSVRLCTPGRANDMRRFEPLFWHRPADRRLDFAARRY
jgi:hypothetical protein